MDKMKDSTIINLDQGNIKVVEDNENDLQFLLSILFKNWYWFALVLILAHLAVHFYVRHTMPVYRTSATILINETDDRPLLDNSELLQGLGLPGGMKNLQNQIMILRSSALTEKTLSDLPFETEYYIKGLRNRVPIYPAIPVKISSKYEIPLPRDTEFEIKYLGNNRFNLRSYADYYPLDITSAFGDTINISEGKIVVECRNEEWFNTRDDQSLYFVVHSRINLINNYTKRINVELISKEGSVLSLSMNGTNRIKDMDFINKHLQKFQTLSLEKKNLEADRRLGFIENQLIGISDSLSLTENRLQQFRSSHRVMDLSAQGQVIIEQVTALEKERSRLNLEANYYDYLADYLAKEASGEIPIIPITMGITDPGLTRLVEELAELQGQMSARGAGAMNPLQRNLEQRVRTTKEALRETLNGLRRANTLARSENQDQINRANYTASSLPVTERQLLGIERTFRLNDELYTFLLETRAELEMQKASNRADSEIIDSADARFSQKISPNPIKLNLIGFIGGFGLTFLIIYLRMLYSKKLVEEDINKITGLPIIGRIPHSPDSGNTIVLNDSSSTTAESFRILRSRMQFLTKESPSPVILVTSAMPGEGKTFTAINLASAYSLLGKKTVLLGFDLRKPKIYQDFDLGNEVGLSTWLIGKDKLHEIIQKTKFENLYVISAGPVPPNPSELTALNKTQELINLLRKDFDFIIIDSSPIGVVSDTFHLASLSDSCLLVVRPGKTLKDMFINTLNEMRINNTKGIGLVINDIQSDSRYYGYGEKYGYTNDKKRSRKKLLKKIRLKKKSS
ncbi:MAG: polysaccharide biosynthesis tyrosine autokinase [Bacteroidales bacterium]